MKIIVDSGSSIKQEEKEFYGVDILPLRVQIGDNSFQDSIDLTADNFYEYLRTDEFPKTSLPSLAEVEELVEGYTSKGEDVLLITISSGISGTFQTFYAMFQDNPNVLVYDSKLAVGGIRFLVEEALRYQDCSLEVVKEKLDALIPRIMIMAIPNTLDYLLAGGRLSKASWMLGSLLSIRPIIGFVDGKVTVLAKKRGNKHGMEEILDTMNRVGVDPTFGIIASYTKVRENVDKLIAMADESVRALVKIYDNLAPSIACHWGPEAFGFIFVKEAE